MKFAIALIALVSSTSSIQLKSKYDGQNDPVRMCNGYNFGGCTDVNSVDAFSHPANRDGIANAPLPVQSFYWSYKGISDERLLFKKNWKFKSKNN